jgi:stage II sporulation protein D
MNRVVPALMGAVVVIASAGCGGGPPRYTASPETDPTRHEPRKHAPAPPRYSKPFGGPLLVRVGLHWGPGSFRVSSEHDLLLRAGKRAQAAGSSVTLTTRGRNGVRVQSGGRVLYEGDEPVSLETDPNAFLGAGELRVRGYLEVSAQSDSLMVVNVLALEDYLRGVVPREIGPRPIEERAAVAAQAVAARTYAVKRLGQYGSLPFDVFATVQDQVYEGAGGENAVADLAIDDTRGLILSDDTGPIETFYSSTCGGMRSDIANVWPKRNVHPALRGGEDGPASARWCRASPHFDWEERWDGGTLSELVRENLPIALSLPPKSVRGELTDLVIRGRGPSGRLSAIEDVTTEGHWTVPGDQNRWILRRPDGGILRSVFVDFDVVRQGGRVARVVARGHGNGHGVGMCQFGAIGRARAGQTFQEILQGYYPGARIRPVRGPDLPAGREGIS